MVKLKTISLTIKFGPQNRKMNYTRNLPSNLVLQTKNLKTDWSKRDKESSKGKPREGTTGDGLCHPLTHGPAVVHASHSADPSLILVLRRPIPLLTNSHQAKRTKERASQGQREKGRSLELEIDSTVIWVVPLTADQAQLNSIANLSYFPLPLSATHVTDLLFFSLPMLANHRKSGDPPWPNCLRRVIYLSFPQTLSLSLSLSQFDWIWWMFFFGFVSFVFIYWEMILYIYLEAEKMWATNRKCVFYSIFKNITKHLKIFFKAFSRT